MERVLLLRHGTDYVMPGGAKARGILRQAVNASGEPPFGEAMISPGQNVYSRERRLFVLRGTGPDDDAIISIRGEAFFVVATWPHDDEWDRVHLREH